MLLWLFKRPKGSLRQYWLALFLLIAASYFSSAQTVNFTPSNLAGESLSSPTSLDFGPDNRLYVSQQNGNILAYTVVKNGPNNYQITATETITVVRNIPNHNDDGTLNPGVTNRQITGILAVGTATNPVLYVSSSDPRIGGGGTGGDLGLDTNSGIISKLTWNGSSWVKVDVVIGLPRSEENHANNGLVLDPATNTLYVAQGGSTNAGSPSNNFAFLTEYALAAAVLKINLTQIETQFGGSYKLPTLDDPTAARNTGTPGVDLNDPFGGNDGLNQAKLLPGMPVQIHSPGYRNIYDLVLTKAAGKAGRMYTVDNGANGGWGGHPHQEGASGNPLTTAVTNQYVAGEPGSNGPGPNDAKVNNLDNLHYVSGPGFAPIYGGHPNPIRANPNGAGLYRYNNATSTAHFELLPTVDWPPVDPSLANPVEGDFRNPGVNDGALHTFPASTNGLTEYLSQSYFGGALYGDLLTASFDGHIYRIQLSPDGKSATSVTSLFSGFGNTPLDVIAQGDGEVFPGTVWVANYTSNSITIFEPVGTAAETWQSETYSGGTPQARHENGFVELGGKFYLLGGRGIKPVDIYDPATKTWTTGAAPPIQLHHFQAATYQGKIYLICAFTGNFPNETPVDKIYTYDPATNSWAAGATIPVSRRRGSAGVVLYNNKFYVGGGLTNGHVNGWVTWMDEFNPATGQWTELANLPEARDHFHAGLINGKIYFAGGRRTGQSGTFGATIANVNVYDIGSNTWSSPTQIPTQRAAAAIATFNNQLLIAGGETGSSSQALSTVELYNPQSNSWITKPSLNVGRHGTQMILHGSKLYVCAGSTTQGGSGENNTMSVATYSISCGGSYSTQLDEDGDGYDNADEIDNGTNPCSAGSKPQDQDLDMTSDLNDPDDDNDGINDQTDKFAWDQANGANTFIDINYPFLNGNPGFGFFGVGHTGLMTNNSSNYASLYDPDHPDLIVGGAVGVLSVPADGGDATSNNQRYAFQFGVNVNQNTPAFTIHSRLLGAPFFDNIPVASLQSQSQGIYFGNGDQNNYFKVVLHGNNGNPGFQLLREENGSVALQQMFPVSNILSAGEVDLYIDVNPSTGSIVFRYSTNQNPTPVQIGSSFQATGNLLNVLQTSTPIAVGVIASSGNAPAYSASWDFLNVTGPPVERTEIVHINVGGSGTQYGNETWIADQYFSGGTLYSTTNAIDNTTKDAIYQTERFGNFSYSIPVPEDASYDVELHFAEIYHGVNNTNGAGARLFNINVEGGQASFQNFDVFQFAGGALRAATLSIPEIEVSDNVLNISFATIVDNSKLSGISVYQRGSSTVNQPPFVIAPYPDQELTVSQAVIQVPLNQIFGDDEGFSNLDIEFSHISTPGLVASAQISGGQLTINRNAIPGFIEISLRATDSHDEYVDTSFRIDVVSGGEPVVIARINAGGTSQNVNGVQWSADQYFSGGSTYSKNTPIGNTTDDVLYHTERWGNVTYQIPVPGPGMYYVDLHFAEIYWTGNNQRVFHFNVENSQFTRQNLDLVQQYGALNAGVIRADNIVVNDGSLTISFTASVNNAKVSALAVAMYPAGGNNPPILQPVANVSLAEGQFWSYQLSATDPDAGDDITYTSQGLPASLTINTNTGLISGTIEVLAGTFPVTVRATDTENEFDEEHFTITITDNQPPVIQAPVVAQSYCRNSPLSIAINATDPEGAQISFSIDPSGDPLPNGLSINSSTGTISGTLLPTGGEGTSTNYDVIVKATDPLNNSSTVTVSIFSIQCGGLQITELILINSVTDVEMFALTNGQSIVIGDLPSSINVKANANQSVGSIRFGWQSNANYRIENVAPYAMAGDNNGDYNNLSIGVGSYTVTATPYTGSGASGTAGTPMTVTFSVVNAPVVNQPPVVSASVQPSYCRGTFVSIQVNGSDPNGDPLTYSLGAGSDPLPNGLSLNASTGLISGTLQTTGGEGNSTLYNVIVVARDPSNATGQTTVPIVSNNCGPSLQITSLVLINSQTNAEITPLSNNLQLNAGSLPSLMNIRAYTNPTTVGSVRFGWQGTTTYRMENVAPYALAGDTNGDFYDLAMGVGTYTVTATPYQNANGGGTAGPPLTITFSIVTSGGSSFARARTAEDTGETLEDRSFALYPNPVQNEFFVKMFVEESGRYGFQMINTLGKETSLGSHDLSAGENLLHFDIEPATTPPGMYFLSVGQGVNKKMIRLVVQ